jgi:hypothetical protein
MARNERKNLMRRFALLLFLSACLSPALRAQDDDKTQCRADNEHNQPYKKKLWDGYEISLGPVPNFAEAEFRCTAAIYNKAGHVVFRTSGFNVMFDEHLTGEDFDGDGKPDVVFETDTGGGMHCCWGYVIVSLSPKPHKLFEIAMQGSVDFEKDKDGKFVIWQRSGGPMAYTSMASRPFAAKVLRVRDGKLVDVTSDFCGTKDQRIERHAITPDDVAKLAHAGDRGAVDYDQLIGGVESGTLQHVFCGEYDAAVKDLSDWPPNKRDEVVKAFSESLAADYPEFEAALRKTFPKN